MRSKLKRLQHSLSPPSLRPLSALSPPSLRRLSAPYHLVTPSLFWPPSGEEELSEVLGYKVVSRSVGPRSGSAVGGAEASDPSVKSPRATPGYNPSPTTAPGNKCEEYPIGGGA